MGVMGGIEKEEEKEEEQKETKEGVLGAQKPSMNININMNMNMYLPTGEGAVGQPQPVHLPAPHAIFNPNLLGSSNIHYTKKPKQPQNPDLFPSPQPPPTALEKE